MIRVLALVVIVVFASIGCGELTVENGDGFSILEDTNNGTEPPTNNGTEPPANNGIAPTNNQITPTNNGTTPIDPGPTCTAPTRLCGDACVDVTSTDEHCGDCNQACPGESMCNGSTCACSGTGELCGDACTDTNANSQHCGGCDMACAGGQLCVNSACVESTNLQSVLQATNAARAAGADCGVYGVMEPAPAIAGDPNLHIAAQAHADDMAINNYFSHTGADGSSFVTRIGRTNFNGQPIGENIAAGGGEGAGVVARWVDSDGHCRNLMNPAATKIGIGYAAGGPYGTSWVQVFGR